MKSRRIVTVAIAALSVGIATNAKVLDPAQAWSRASNTPELHKINGTSTVRPQLLHTCYADELPTSYIFKSNNSQGFVVVAADDAVVPLLGYSDNEYEDDNMPDGLHYWLDEFSRQIAWARANDIEYTSWQGATKAAIEPMTKTKWNQNAPYNDLCPTYKGQRCVTGCVATAGAQAMKYRNWPDVGEGEITYTAKTIDQQLSMNFADVKFDWNDMLNTYGSDATNAQNEAVAKLMQAVGYSVSMDYTTDESGAEVTDLAKALADNFKYDKGLSMQMRCLYTISDWNDYVYNQLATYGPVIYAGESNEGGHCFVCDGYSQDGYFHFNWGWGGMSDGYFLLTALDPGAQGIGGTTSAYNFYQQIIADLCKAGEGSGKVVKQLYTECFEMPQTVTIGESISVEIPVSNNSIVALNGNLGLKVVSPDGTVKYAQGTELDDFETDDSKNSWEVQMPDLQDGNYTVTPAWYDSEAKAWQPISVSIASPQSYMMTVSGSSATLQANGNLSLSVTDFEITSLYTDAKFSITAKIQNTGNDEVFQYAIPAFVQNGGVQMYGDMILLDILPGETMDVDFLSDLQAAENSSVEAGTYGLYLLSVIGEELYSYGEVQVNEGTSPSLNFGALSFTDGNTTSVDANDVEMQASIECTDGYFADTITAYIFPDSSGTVYSVGYVTSQAVFLNAGDSDTLKFSGSFEGTEGSSYYAIIMYNNQYVDSTAVVFTLGESGIWDVRNDNQPTVFYTLNGAQMTGTSLTPGMYLMRVGNKVTKIVVR